MCSTVKRLQGYEMTEKKLQKPKTRKPVSTRPGKVILSKKEIEEKKRFRKTDWEKEIRK